MKVNQSLNNFERIRNIFHYVIKELCFEGADVTKSIECIKVVGVIDKFMLLTVS